MNKKEWLVKKAELDATFPDRTEEQIEKMMVAGFGECPKGNGLLGFVNVYPSRVGAVLGKTPEEARRNAASNTTHVAAAIYEHPQPEVVECGFCVVYDNGESGNTMSLSDAQIVAGNDLPIHRAYRSVEPITEEK